MTPLTPSRVPLLLETTKVTKPVCSAAKIWGRTAFCHGEAPDWVFWRASAKVRSGKFRSIEFSKQFHMNFAIPYLLTYKTQKLTKASENNKAKGLTNVNQGVQIHNIWHSSPRLLETWVFPGDLNPPVLYLLFSFRAFPHSLHLGNQWSLKYPLVSKFSVCY
jgi:hypothetical protein